MPSLTQTLLLGALVSLSWLSAPALADTSSLKHKALWSPKGLGKLNTGHNGGLNAMASSGIESLVLKPWGVAPETCVETANEADKNNGGKKRCQPEDLEVYEVKYDDCGEPVVMCRCKTAQIDIQELAFEFGKVPVRARQWVRHLTAMPDKSCHAWAWMGGDNNNIVILGPCHNATSVYLHEVGHCLDAAAGAMKASYSNKAEYQDIVEADTCISDSYAHNGWADNFAQVVVMATYHHNVQPIWEHKTSPECMRGALDNVLSLLGSIPARRLGDTCEGALPNDNDVCVGKAAREQGLCEGIPDAKKNGRSSKFDKREREGHTHQLGPKLTDEERQRLEEINNQIKHDDLEHIYETEPAKRSLSEQFRTFRA